MAARRFEFDDGTTSKFWTVTVDGSQTTTSWGRLGTNGQTKAKEFDSPAKAQADADKKAAEKQKKGYQEVAVAIGPPVPVVDTALTTGIEFPAAWQKKVLARRGFPSAALPLSPKPNPGRGRRDLVDMLDEHHAFIKRAARRSPDLDPALLAKLLDPSERSMLTTQSNARSLHLPPSCRVANPRHIYSTIGSLTVDMHLHCEH